MYLGVLAVGFVGALIARFQPRGMALALFATAVAQMLVPVIALVIWKAGWQDLLIDPNSPHPPFDPGIAQVFGLNAVFAVMWVASAMLFRHAGDPSPKIAEQSQAACNSRSSRRLAPAHKISTVGQHCFGSRESAFSPASHRRAPRHDEE